MLLALILHIYQVIFALRIRSQGLIAIIASHGDVLVAARLAALELDLLARQTIPSRVRLRLKRIRIRQGLLTRLLHVLYWYNLAGVLRVVVHQQ